MDIRLKHEIDHGKKISSDADDVWGWSGKAGNLRWERRVRMLLNGIQPHHRVLEVGCGTGLLTKDISESLMNLYPLDISIDLLKIASKRVDDNKVTFFCSNAYELGFKDNTFDCIIGMSVLHHLNIDKALLEFRRVLKEGGRIIFSEPNMLNPQIFMERTFFREYFHNSPDETAFVRFPLKHKLKKYNFKNISISPFDFLHPKTPSSLVKTVEFLSNSVERIPVLSEFAGSLFIEATK